MVDAGMAAAESAIADVSILERADLEMLRQRIYDGEQALRALRWEIAPALWIAPVLGVLPVYGGDIQKRKKM